MAQIFYSIFCKQDETGEAEKLFALFTTIDDAYNYALQAIDF